MSTLALNTSWKQIVRLALPISLAILIPQVSIFTNNVFLARLGERELGVNSITGVYYLMLSMIGYGLSSGVQIQMARRAGEENKAGITKTFMNGLMLAHSLSLVLIAISILLIPPLFGANLNDPINYTLSLKYIQTRMWGLPFLLTAQLFSSFFIAIGRTRLLIYGSLVNTVLNILFDYLLIFGKSGFPHLGFMGAAWASIIAECGYACTLAGIFMVGGFGKDFQVLRYLGFDVRFSIQSLRTAAPLIVQFLFSIGGWLLFFFFIEHLGQRPLAASQMLRSIFGIVSVGTWALATTANTLVSNLIGQGKTTQVVSVIMKVCGLSLLYCTVLCVALLLFSHQFLGIYTNDIALIEYAIPSLRIIVVATLVMALSTVAFNGVAGTGNTTMNMLIELTCMTVYLVYCWYFIEHRRSELYICWASEFVYWIALLIASGIYLRSGKWRGKAI